MLLRNVHRRADCGTNPHSFRVKREARGKTSRSRATPFRPIASGYFLFETYRRKSRRTFTWNPSRIFPDKAFPLISSTSGKPLRSLSRCSRNHHRSDFFLFLAVARPVPPGLLFPACSAFQDA